MIFHGWSNFAVNLSIQILLKLALPFHCEKREPALVRTDNWTNFVSGEKELHTCIQKWKRQGIYKYLFQQQVHWIFNHPAASHYGGIWEQCIRTTRKILSALLNEKALVTLMCKVEAISKGRPITVSERTPEIFPLITCFYHDKETFYHQVFCKVKITALEGGGARSSTWRINFGNAFPFVSKAAEVEADDTTPRSSWPSPRVIEVMPGSDGFVRRV